tara:strand:+ start:241 stop:450 length:210 start_codon:yes stop_codon:yes gene_type:complete
MKKEDENKNSISVMFWMWIPALILLLAGKFGPTEDFINNIILLKSDLYNVFYLIILLSILAAVKKNKKS